VRARKSKQRFTFTTRYSLTPMTPADWEACEDLLAHMVARAIADEHPEWVGKHPDR